LQSVPHVIVSPLIQHRSSPAQSSFPSHSAEVATHTSPAAAHDAVRLSSSKQHWSVSAHALPPQITPSPLPLPIGSARRQRSKMQVCPDGQPWSASQRNALCP
jgi:hypothetical protein